VAERRADAGRRDLYDVLGVARDATPDELQRAYRKLARTHHPDVDRSPGADARFAEVAEAYEVLSDPDTRRRYDAFGHAFRQFPEGAEQARAGRGPGAAGRSDARGGGWRGAADGGVDVEDLFGDLFGSWSGGMRWGTVAGADQEAELPLTVEEAFRGGEHAITVSGPSGQRRIVVKVPAGVVDGQRIRLAGQGARGAGGAPAGDLYLVVRIRPHRRYRLEGRNLYVELPVSPWEAALGTTVAVETPGGEAKVKVPPGSSSGRRLRLAGQGLPRPGGKAGHLYAEVRIVVPPHPTDEERSLFEELARISTFDPRRSR
jgi:curved DNA-binding protein